jgi:hypothetical protein
VYDGDNHLLTINPTNENEIFCIVIESPLITSLVGGSIGDSYFLIFGEPDSSTMCVPLQEEFSGKVSCRAPGTRNIYFVFTGEWTGPDGQVPPAEVLKNRKVEKIVWRLR